MGGGLDRRQAGTVDRGRRQAEMRVRVVGGAGAQLRHGQRPGEVAGRVAGGRVELKHHPVGQPVVDHRRDQRTSALGGGLGLDQRGDLQHVVGGQVLAPGVAEVDLREPLLEVTQLVVDQRRGLDRIHQGERVREQEALQRWNVPRSSVGVWAQQRRAAGRGEVVAPDPCLRSSRLRYWRVWPSLIVSWVVFAAGGALVSAVSTAP